MLTYNLLVVKLKFLVSEHIHMLWFIFILGLSFIFLCFKLIIIHYHTPKQRKIKFKPRIKLNSNTYVVVYDFLTEHTSGQVKTKFRLKFFNLA